jgi:excisionase family DNA binding protein
MTQGEAGRSPVLTPEEGGITFREACLRLNISEKTLRAKIKSGEVQAWQVEGKRGKEWRVQVLGGREEGRDQEGEARTGEREGRDQRRDGDGDHSRPSGDLWQEFLTRHEAAVQQLGYFKAKAEEVKALTDGLAGEQRRAAEAEERARRLIEDKERIEREKQEEHQARRTAEEEADRLRRELEATKGALEAERGKGFLARLLGK